MSYLFNLFSCLKKCINCFVNIKAKLPDGCFQRFIVRAYELKLFNDIGPWANGFVGVCKNYRMKVIHERIDRSSCITIEGYANDNDVYHTWDLIIPLIKVSHTSVCEEE